MLRPPSRVSLGVLAVLVVSLQPRSSRADDDSPAPVEPAPPSSEPTPEPPPAPSEGGFDSPSPRPGEAGPNDTRPTAEVPPPQSAAAPPASGGFPADPTSTTPSSQSRGDVSTPVRTLPKRSTSQESRYSRVETEVPPARRAAALPPEPEPEKKDSSDGLFGPIRLGFLVGLGLPNLLNFGGTAKITRFLGGGINVGIIPTARLSYYGEATLSYQEYDIYGRIYPFGGGFFIGAGAGYEQVRGTLRGNVDLAKYTSNPSLIPPGLLPPGYQLPTAVDYEARGSVRTLVLTPQLGYLHTFGSGFSIGIDVGAQIPIAPSAIKFESTVSPSEVAQLAPFQEQQKKVRDTLETVGRTPLPSLNLRIGWLL